MRPPVLMQSIPNFYYRWCQGLRSVSSSVSIIFAVRSAAASARPTRETPQCRGCSPLPAPHSPVVTDRLRRGALLLGAKQTEMRELTERIGRGGVGRTGGDSGAAPPVPRHVDMPRWAPWSAARRRQLLLRFSLDIFGAG